ncbi:hypothetical protein TNCV_2183621 [Trichonephila clavipes]|nr:hypothetical protein TNCV_2183621 [Trichonephila clavipes]
MRNVISVVAILSALAKRSIERLKGTWSRVPKSRRRTFRTLWELLCCPHETNMGTITSKMEKVFSSEPFHQSGYVSYDHLRVCELHFSDDAIRRYTEAYNEKTGEKIYVPLKRFRLQNFAVPTIFIQISPHIFLTLEIPLENVLNRDCKD